MKYALFGIVIAVLGFGEYVFVEVAPYPPERRIQRARQIPLVKDVVSAWQASKYEKWSKEGNPYASAALYHEGQIQKDEDVMARAKKRLLESDTDVARLNLYVINSEGRIAGDGVEWTVLVMKAARENIPNPWASEEQIRTHKMELDEWRERVYWQAEQGDERAQRIVAALEA